VEGEDRAPIMNVLVQQLHATSLTPLPLIFHVETVNTVQLLLERVLLAAQLVFRLAVLLTTSALIKELQIYAIQTTFSAEWANYRLMMPAQLLLNALRILHSME
jgi:hypothetical protein